MINDFKNVVISFGLVALIFVGSFLSYQRKVDVENLVFAQQQEVQKRDEEFLDLGQNLFVLQNEVADLKRQNQILANENASSKSGKTSAPTNQSNSAQGNQLVQAQIIASQQALARAQAQLAATQTQSQSQTKPPAKVQTVKKVVVKPSRQSRAS